MSKIVNRTLDVFELFAREQKPLSLTELVRRLDIPMSSCHDVVRALEARGYLYEVKSRAGYYPTARLYRLGQQIVQHDPIAARAETLLEEISLQLNASVSLSRAKDTQCTYLLVCVPPDPLAFHTQPGDSLRNLYATSAGKAVLGSFSEEERRKILEQTPLELLTPHTLTSVDAILADVAEGEARGYFVNREESVEDALTLSVRMMRNNDVYVLTVAGTRRRMERRFDEALAALQAAARELERDG